MLKYPCLVLDHDDTVVQSETTINYPFFCYILDQFRPGATITREEYTKGCFHPGFAGMCREKFHFTEQELQEEYTQWKAYIRTHIPAPYPGIERIIYRQKEEGGILCVVSQSSQENIARDYAAHFGIQPDAVFGWDAEPEHRKPNTWALQQIMDTYHLTADQILVVDDMKAAVGMARAGGCPIAFAGWGRTEFPEIYGKMSAVCDFSFDTVEKFEKFLFA